MIATEEKRNIYKLFLKEWPIDRLEKMTLEEYALGNDGNYKDSLCYWLETKTNELGKIGGLGGGGAFKFGVYHMTNIKNYSNHNVYNSDGIYAWVRKWGNSANEVFVKIKQLILKTANASINKQFELIDGVLFPYAPLKWKIAFLYSNEQLINIFKEDALIIIARKLGMKSISIATFSALNLFIMKQKPDDISVFDYSKKMWQMYQKNQHIDYYIIGSWYGEKGSIFSNFLEKKVIGTDFYTNNLADLYLKPKKEIKNYLKEKGEAGKSYNALAHFLNIKLGDKIAIKSDGSPKGNKGYLKIIGFAEVVERNNKVYDYDEELGHIIHVNYTEANINLELSLGGYGSTIHHLKKQDHIRTIFENSGKNLFSSTQKNDKIQQTVLNIPLNQILYGPPGTGKTYQTREIAYEIIKGKKPSKGHQESIDLFKELKSDQIEFITFHQNYSYEDFVQGLRPDVEQKNLAFERKDGVFKKICTRALYEYYKASKKQRLSISQKDLDFDEIYLDFVADLKNKKEPVIFKTSTGSDILLAGISTHDNLYFKHKSGSRQYTVSATRLKKLLRAIPDFQAIKNIHEEIINAIRGCNSTVYWVAANEFLKFKKYRQSSVDFVEEEIYEDVSYKTMINHLQNFNSSDIDFNTLEIEKNYVLIIDEINRANISRVFGELITLLEADKRFGATEEIEVQLPSGDKFIVPPNLYLIGTMNTADKSIALLDIALRRRFEFVPIYPKMELIPNKYKSLFDDLNKKIALEKSPDFTIGHSYFMTKNGKSASLKDIMNNKVIPLLLEYFMNDIKRVEKLLKSVNIETKKMHYGILEFSEYKTKTNKYDET